MNIMLLDLSQQPLKKCQFDGILLLKRSYVFSNTVGSLLRLSTSRCAQKNLIIENEFLIQLRAQQNSCLHTVPFSGSWKLFDYS